MDLIERASVFPLTHNEPCFARRQSSSLHILRPQPVPLPFHFQFSLDLCTVVFSSLELWHYILVNHHALVKLLLKSLSVCSHRRSNVYLSRQIQHRPTHMQTRINLHSVRAMRKSFVRIPSNLTLHQSST